MKNSMSLDNALRQNQEKRGKLLKMKAKNIDLLQEKLKLV